MLRNILSVAAKKVSKTLKILKLMFHCTNVWRGKRTLERRA